MITNEKIDLLNVWRKDLFNELSISEIMKLSGKKTKTWVFNSLRYLVDREILNSKRKGNMNIYNVNMENPMAIQLVHYLEIQENINFSEKKLVSNIISSIPIKNYSLIIFGSYAEGKQTKKSDLDICFLVEERNTEKKMKPYINDIKLSTPIKIDDHYITFDEFVAMLLRNEENLGKQIFKKHKIFYNADIYYNLIKEAYKRGFR